jgi:phosphate acetyltransferase
MFIPTEITSDTSLSIKNLKDALGNNKFPVKLFPSFDLNVIENFLADDRKEDLLITIIRQCEELTAYNEIILMSGIPANRPYAQELNLTIAVSLGAALIFVVPNLTIALRKQLKIILNFCNCQHRPTILGFTFNDTITQHQELPIDISPPFLGTFKSNDTFDRIHFFLKTPKIQRITPAVFKYQLIERARKIYRKIILPEGAEPRTIAAANICSEYGIAECILLEEKNKIYNTCKNFNLKLHEQIQIIEPHNILEKYIIPLYELRHIKGLSIDGARQQLKDNVVLGTMMLYANEVDGLVSGAVHTTANTIRPAFQIIKARPEVKLVSSVFFMCLPHQIEVFGDCAINPDPNPEELADIAIQSAKSAVAFGINPKVAMLSYSTGDSGIGPSVEKIKMATHLVRELQPNLEIKGPIQYDAAVSEETEKIKSPQSKASGHATVLIMPNLDVGNIVYKAIQRNTGITCIGPILQGLYKPVNDLSRGCAISDIVFTIAVTAIQA